LKERAPKEKPKTQRAMALYDEEVVRYRSASMAISGIETRMSRVALYEENPFAVLHIKAKRTCIQNSAEMLQLGGFRGIAPSVRKQ
jgi:hypothetical protein